MKQRVFLVLVSACFLEACGGGVPVRLRIDEFTMEVELDEAVDKAYGQFLAQGFLGEQTNGIPEIWPDNLPDIRYRAQLATTPVPVDLTPEASMPEGETPPEGEGKYDKINKVGDAIRRIEINRFILRMEQSTLTLGLPELRLQVADDAQARPDDRLAWRTVGVLPATPEAAFVGDKEFEFLPGGESFLNAQLGDELKEFAMRIVGKIDIDTAVNDRRPSGKAVARLIIVATFFVKPEGAL